MWFSKSFSTSFEPSTVLYNPKSKLPTVDAFSEIVFNEFHSSDILLFFFKKDLTDSKIYFADLVLRDDWPKIISGFLASLIKLDTSWLSSVIFLIFSISPFKDSYG